jgi:hypothetical protein
MSRRRSGRAVPAPVRMRQWRARQRARGLKPLVRWVARRDLAQAPPAEQRRLEAQMLALCVMTVEKIDRDPALLDVVFRNFERWEARGRLAPGPSIRAWRRVLGLPWPQIAARLTEQSAAGVQLRSTAPVFGVLSARERRRIFEAFRLVPPRRRPSPPC